MDAGLVSASAGRDASREGSAASSPAEASDWVLKTERVGEES